MTQARRIGVFGGTFDPIHKAHLAMAHTAMDAGRLDTVVFMVASIPPHKQDSTHASPEDRLAMVEAAIADVEGFDVSDRELHREGPSYTADTLRDLQAEYPDAELFMIIGEDSLVDFPKWRQPEVILDYARLLVLPRPGCDTPIHASLAGHYDLLPFDESPISSTAIRHALEAGESLTAMLPAPVIQFIEDRGLYGR
jgi:nicotinate-nucleotide adenylyltransferase